jgi:hypothetical protein
MPDETTNVADTQATETDSMDFVNSINEDVAVSDAADSVNADSATAGEKGASDDAAKAAEGVQSDKDGDGKPTPPDKPKDGDLPEFKYRLNPEHKAFFEGRGLIKDNALDIDNLAKSFKDNLKYFNDVNTVQSHLKSQLQSLRGKTETAKPPTREEVDTQYQESLAELKKVWDSTNLAKKALEGRPDAGPIMERLDATLEHLRALDSENQRTRQQKLHEIEVATIRQELGLSMPHSDDISSDRAKTVANETFEKLLKPVEIGDKAFLTKVLQPGKPFLHALAASTFPNLYDPEQPNSEQSTEAIHRVMMDEKVAEIVVDYGRAKMVAEGAEAAKKAFGETEYKRGLEDMKRQLGASGTLNPSSDPVKKVAIQQGENDGFKFVSDLIAQQNE